mgnify:CR=1 FL=1
MIDNEIKRGYDNLQFWLGFKTTEPVRINPDSEGQITFFMHYDGGVGVAVKLKQDGTWSYTVGQ